MKTFSVSFDITLIDEVDEVLLQDWIEAAINDHVISEFNEVAGNFEVREVAT